jgi:hypothetical protein
MTQVKSVMSRRARLARAIAGQEREYLPRRGVPLRRNLTSQQKLKARHMARSGKNTAQIAEAIGWPFTLDLLRCRLREINIHCTVDTRAASDKQ